MGRRTYLRATAAVGALGLGLLAMSPAVAATESQAGANAFSIEIAGQGAQGTGLSTATYENGHETKSGEITPAFPQPAQDNFKLGVLVQEATAGPDGSAACAGLGGDGKGQITIGDSSCLVPGNNLEGSLGTLSLSSLITASTSQLPAEVTGPLGQVTGGAAAVTDAIDGALAQAKQQLGDGGLVMDLDAVQGRCTYGADGPKGDTTLTNARIAFSGGGQDVTLVDLPTHPEKNSHVFTDLSKVVNAILDGVDTDLTTSLQGNLAPLKQLTAAVRENIVTNIHDQLEKNLKPLEDNLLDITLNWQQETNDSIKVRAVNVDVLPAAKDQLQGKPLVNLQIGNAACAPVAQAAEVSPPQAVSPPAANPKTPTAVSSGLASAPAVHERIAPSTWALVALAALGLVGSGLVGVRRWLD